MNRKKNYFFKRNGKNRSTFFHSTFTTTTTKILLFIKIQQKKSDHRRAIHSFQLNSNKQPAPHSGPLIRFFVILLQTALRIYKIDILWSLLYRYRYTTYNVYRFVSSTRFRYLQDTRSDETRMNSLFFSVAVVLMDVYL